MLIGYESIQVYATFPGCPSGASHSDNIIYSNTIPPLPTVPPQKRNSQMDSSVQDNLAAPSPAGFESCRVYFHWNIRLIQPGQAKVVLGPTPLARICPVRPYTTV